MQIIVMDKVFGYDGLGAKEEIRTLEEKIEKATFQKAERNQQETVQKRNVATRK